MYVLVRVCVCERERERESGRDIPTGSLRECKENSGTRRRRIANRRSFAAAMFVLIVIALLNIIS